MTDEENEDVSGTATIVRDLTNSYGNIINTVKKIVHAVDSNAPSTGLSEIRVLNNEADLAQIVSSLVYE